MKVELKMNVCSFDVFVRSRKTVGVLVGELNQRFVVIIEKASQYSEETTGENPVGNGEDVCNLRSRASLRYCDVSDSRLAQIPSSKLFFGVHLLDFDWTDLIKRI